MRGRMHSSTRQRREKMENEETRPAPDTPAEPGKKDSGAGHSKGEPPESAPDGAAAERPGLPPWMTCLIRNKKRREREQNKNPENEKI